MNDILLEWAGDLTVGSTGDIALVAGSDMTKQRVARRLLTNAGGYLWHLDYGGGLGRFVGSPARPVDIESIIRTQLRLETAVSLSPSPQVNVEIADAANGLFVTNIIYVDGSTDSPSQLSLSPGQPQ